MVDHPFEEQANYLGQQSLIRDKNVIEVSNHHEKRSHCSEEKFEEIYGNSHQIELD